MLKALVRSCLVLALASSMLPVSFARELPQRRVIKPSNNAPNGIEALGIWQPESVRAILLLYSGKSLSKQKADEFESTLRKEPAKLDERVVLIGYYSANAKTPADRARLRIHVLWMIENHPEHPATAEPSLRDLPDDAEANAQIRDLWKRNLESRGDDLAVLKNAEKFFFSK